MINWLEKERTTLVSNYCDSFITKKLWVEIKTKYTLKARHYHNLSHLHNMLFQLENFKTKIQDLEALKLAIWYHDVIYKSHKKDNESKSAILAAKRLQLLDFDEKRIEIVKKMIISTKTHQLILRENTDNAFLLDLDLSILGTNWKTYQTYIRNIRKEYKIYPDFMYNSGRKKVLHYFLERDFLYFTEAFRDKFEKQARENLKKEIGFL